MDEQQATNEEAEKAKAGNSISEFMQVQPPLVDGTLKCASAETISRWTYDLYRYPLYQYANVNGVVDKGRWRCLNYRERLMRMGFPWSHLDMASSKGELFKHPLTAEDVKSGLIGRSLSVPGVAWLFSHFLSQEKILPAVADVKSCWSANRRSEEDDHMWSTMDMAKVLIRNSIYRGSDVRLTSGLLMNPASWPRQSFDTSMLQWKVVLAFPQSGQHINALELRAALAAQKWMRRAARNIHSRFIHCLDSQVCIAVATKARSSAHI